MTVRISSQYRQCSSDEVRQKTSWNSILCRRDFLRQPCLYGGNRVRICLYLISSRSRPVSLLSLSPLSHMVRCMFKPARSQYTIAYLAMKRLRAGE